MRKLLSFVAFSVVLGAAALGCSSCSSAQQAAERQILGAVLVAADRECKGFVVHVLPMSQPDGARVVETEAACVAESELSAYVRERLARAAGADAADASAE